MSNPLPSHLPPADTWLCNNYRPGDRIYTFGFSRGAFAARCFAGLVRLRRALFACLASVPPPCCTPHQVEYCGVVSRARVETCFRTLIPRDGLSPHLRDAIFKLNAFTLKGAIRLGINSATNATRLGIGSASASKSWPGGAEWKGAVSEAELAPLPLAEQPVWGFPDMGPAPSFLLPSLLPIDFRALCSYPQRMFSGLPGCDATGRVAVHMVGVYDTVPALKVRRWGAFFVE